MFQVDLNSDLGESFGRYTIGQDEEIMNTVTSVHIACGVHAGDPMVMDRTIQSCKEKGVAPGAHPGFPDLQGFGRRRMYLNPGELKNYILYQLGALSAFAAAHGLRLQHVKPHGALNNMMPYSEQYSEEICQAVLAFDPELILVAPSNTMTLRMARDKGIRVISEVFADRAYQDDGYLLPRSCSGSMVEDEEEAIARVIRMVKEGKVTAASGKEVAVEAQSICVHSDSAVALRYARKVRCAMEKEGIRICPMRELA